MPLAYIRSEEQIKALKPTIHANGLHIVRERGRKVGYTKVFLNGAATPTFVQTRIPHYLQ